MKRTMKLLFLLAVSAASAFSAGEKSVYWLNFDPTSDSWKIILPAPHAELVYEDATTAVDIQRVICNGQSITPEIFGGYAPGFPDLVVMDAPEGQVIYQCSTASVASWINLVRQKDRLFGMKTYNLPTKINTLEVVYIVRYPDGSRSGPIHVSFVPKIRDAKILELPNSKTRLLERDDVMIREGEKPLK